MWIQRVFFSFLLVCRGFTYGQSHEDCIVHEIVDSKEFYNLFRLDKKDTLNILDTNGAFDLCEMDIYKGIKVNIYHNLEGMEVEKYISVIKYEKLKKSRFEVIFYEVNTHKKLEMLIKKRRSRIEVLKISGGVF